MSNSIGYGEQRLIQEIINKSFPNIEMHDRKFTINDILYIIQEMKEEEGRRYLNPQSTRTGFFIFRQFVQHLLARNIANYDSMLLLTSEKGTGKSSAAIMIAREWCNLLGIKFNPARHLAYNNKDVMKKIDMLNRFEPIVCDEAVRFASSADWAKAESKELKKKISEVRTKHLLFILCFPLKISKIEKNYLDSFVNYWCDLFGRGRGAIYVKDKNPHNDPWRLKDFKNVGSYTQFTTLTQIEKKLKKHPNFWKLIKFPKPPAHIYNRYLKVREDNVYNDRNVRDMVTSGDIHKALLLLSLQDVMMNDKTLNLNRISLHIKEKYNIPISKKIIQNLMLDSKKLVTNIREESLR